jgi:hypothetical protein
LIIRDDVESRAIVRELRRRRRARAVQGQQTVLHVRFRRHPRARRRDADVGRRATADECGRGARAGTPRDDDARRRRATRRVTLK